MLCSRCGSPVESSQKECANCGAALQTTRRLELSNSRGLRISQQLKAIRVDEQLFPPGEIVADRFELAEMLGKGPFGEVYRAHDDLIDSDVALKVLSADVIRTPIDQERYEKSMKAARAADRPNLVRIHDAGLHKDHPYVSMQLLEGLSLRKLVDLRRSKGEDFDLEEVERVVEQVCDALSGRDVPHGDLKPENIIFLPEMVKVTDSFLAPSLAPEVFSERLGESPYIAPEVDSEAGAGDPRVDVYSLGAIVGEMIFGEDYTPGSPNRDDLPAVDALCRRATAFDPAERFADLAEFKTAFEQAMERGDALAAAAAPPAPGGPKAPPPAPGAPASEAKSPPPAPGGPKVPPPAPAAPASGLLDIETAEDIAEPLEEDIQTVEFDRDEHVELGDLLPTNEVDRDNMPPPPKAPANEKRRTNTQTAITRPPSKDDDAGPPWGIIAVIVLVVGGLAAIVAFSGNDEGTKRVVNLAGGDAGVATAQTTATSPADAGIAQASTDAGTDAATAPSPEFLAAVTMASSKSSAGFVAAATEAQKAGEAAAAGANEEGTGTETGTGAASSSTSSASSSTTSEKPEPKPSTGTECKGGMVLVKSKSGNFCVDAFEYPGRGAIPRTRVTWFDAKKACAGRGKRLCSLKEWKSACGSRYPYGRRHDANACNTADEDGFERSIAKSGSFQKCRSRGSGAYDMVGNVHEWVSDQRIAGGGFESDEEVGSCRYSSPKSPSSSAGYVGFRCCADPE